MGELILIVNHTKKEYIDPHSTISGLKECIMRNLMYCLRLSWAGNRIQVVGENQALFFEILENYEEIKWSE